MKDKLKSITKDLGKLVKINEILNSMDWTACTEIRKAVKEEIEFQKERIRIEKIND